MNEQRWPAAAWAAAGLLFILLATANSAGYRYGVSDQAFHVPAVMRALNPAAFPRDRALLDAQARYMLFDDAVAAVVRATGLSIEHVFLAGYLASVVLLWLGIVSAGRRALQAPWAVALFGALITLRHRIPRTSANSLEPYFYPRTLAFAIGVLAIAAFLHRRRWLTIALVAVAAAAHVTTGLWFAILLGVACAWVDTRLRRLAWVTVAAILAAAVWATATGRLTASMTPMDAAWLQPMTTKDSLFANQWPLWAWVANLAPPALLAASSVVRKRNGWSSDEDNALAWGALALVGVFLLSVPFVAKAWAFPTQLQISRVLWLVDFVTTMYLVALVVDLARRANRLRYVRHLALAVLAISMARGTFVMLAEHRERTLFQVRLPQSDWTEAMAWIATQPIGVHVLAHPNHALLYGSSVRVAAGRDVVLEDNKDTAVALYSRDLAVRITERRAAIGDDFDHLSAPAATALARRYDVDYLVTAGPELPFSVAHQNATFRVYEMRRW